MAFNGGMGMVHTRHGSIRSSFPAPLCGGTDIGSICGRLALGYHKNCDMRFHTCSSNTTCHFVSRRGGPFVILGRATSFGFSGSCRTFMPCVGSGHGNRHCYFSFRSCCSRTPLSGVRASSLSVAPLVIYLSKKGGTIVVRTKLRGCPNVFLAMGPRAHRKIRTTFTPCPLRRVVNKRGQLGLVPAGHTSCVTHYTGRRLP